MHLNTLDYERWNEKTKDKDWLDIYREGWKKLRKLRISKDNNRDFGFDVLMANPPFAGDIKETLILAKYELGKKTTANTNPPSPRYFVCRAIVFVLKAGCRGRCL